MHLSRLPHVRSATSDDLFGMKRVLDATQLFPSGLLDDMAAGFFDGTAHGEGWLTADAGGGPLAFAYYVAERMTEGTWNLLAIAVDPDHQGQGIGAALLAHIERELTERGQRMLLVETSGLPEFARTRAFYSHNAYDEEARIRDFYAAGDDKVVYRKALG